MRITEALTTTGSAALGILGGHMIFMGTRQLVPGAGSYGAAAAEILAGVLAFMFGRRVRELNIVGGVMIAEGVLDMLYAGKVIAVEL